MTNTLDLESLLVARQRLVSELANYDKEIVACVRSEACAISQTLVEPQGGWGPLPDLLQKMHEDSKPGLETPQLDYPPYFQDQPFLSPDCPVLHPAEASADRLYAPLNQMELVRTRY